MSYLELNLISTAASSNKFSNIRLKTRNTSSDFLWFTGSFSLIIPGKLVLFFNVSDIVDRFSKSVSGIHVDDTKDSLQQILTFWVYNMLKYVLSLITSRSVCVDQVPYDVFGYEFLTDIFSCFGLLFIAGFLDMSSAFLYKNTNTTKTGFLLYCFSFFTFLSGLTYACTFTFFYASKNMQSEYCYRMSNNTAFQFLREELLKLLTLCLNWIKFWRNDCSNSWLSINGKTCTLPMCT